MLLILLSHSPSSKTVLEHASRVARAGDSGGPKNPSQRALIRALLAAGSGGGALPSKTEGVEADPGSRLLHAERWWSGASRGEVLLQHVAAVQRRKGESEEVGQGGGAEQRCAGMANMANRRGSFGGAVAGRAGPIWDRSGLVGRRRGG